VDWVCVFVSIFLAVWCFGRRRVRQFWDMAEGVLTKVSLPQPDTTMLRAPNRTQWQKLDYEYYAHAALHTEQGSCSGMYERSQELSQKAVLGVLHTLDLICSCFHLQLCMIRRRGCCLSIHSRFADRLATDDWSIHPRTGGAFSHRGFMLLGLLWDLGLW
jgi:hypothetical protein